MIKIGIVGHNGYIGSYIYDSLLNAGYDVIPLDYRYKPINISDISILNIIIYTGGITTRTLCGVISKEEIVNKNIDDIIKLSSVMNSSQVIIYLSTAAVYEGYGIYPQDESVRVLSDVLDVYSLTMYEKERAIARLTNCNSIGLRIGMTCGISRKQRYDLAYMNMIHTSLTEAIIYLDVNNPSRSILGLDDLFRCIETLITKRDSLTGHRIYNICSFNTDMNQLAKYISSELNSSIIAINTTKMNTIGFAMNTNKFCEEFNFSFHETMSSILSKFVKHKDIFYTFTSKCRICKKGGLELILDLGNQPLVNNLLVNKDDETEAFPLNIYGCKSCYHTQLGCTVPPLKMFNFYTYISGVSSSAISHFKMLAEYLIASAKRNSSVLEIASNDGCQLDFFRSAGFQTFGVDPAQNICEIAKKKGHTIICDYWGDKVFPSLPNKFDIILAQNVLAHVPDPVIFVEKCKEYMRDDTILYLQTSQCEMYLNNEFDTIYHEHMSFFTLESFKMLAEKCNLTITGTKKFPIHGISYGLTFQTARGPHCEEFIQYLGEEYSRGMYSSSFYYQYRSKVIKFKYDMLNILEEYRKDYTIVGYGAAAKGITMLNYINFKHIDYIVDDCELKCGKFTPGLKIPIVTKEILQNDTRSLLIIILPWNIKEELISKIQTLIQGRGVRILIPFPSIVIN
jgi:nucleoside-diphosphate-sugar epimerase/2-polyprenyl-3-methyl-5-hydroxy-6-metoxy-1,4-benzoquinol methylase